MSRTVHAIVCASVGVFGGCMLSVCALLIVTDRPSNTIQLAAIGIGAAVGAGIGYLGHLRSYRPDMKFMSTFPDPKQPLPTPPWYASSGGAQIGAGISMILGAIVWFVLGIVALNRIYYYPPVLLVLGIAAIVQGIRNL